MARRRGAGGCGAFEPSIKCHCSHYAGSHSTRFVRAFLPRRHRDWVVVGVRPETTAAANRYRAKPLAVRDALRAKNGIGPEGAPEPPDLFRSRRYDRGPAPAKLLSVLKRQNDAAMEHERAWREVHEPDLARKYEEVSAEIGHQLKQRR